MTRHEIGRRAITILLGLLVLGLFGFGFRELDSYNQERNALSPWAQELYGVEYVTTELRAEYGGVDNEELERLADIRRELFRDCARLSPDYGSRFRNRRDTAMWRCIVQEPDLDRIAERLERVGFVVRLTAVFQTGPILNEFYASSPFDNYGCADMSRSHLEFVTRVANPGYGIPRDQFPQPDPPQEWRDHIEQDYHKFWANHVSNALWCNPWDTLIIDKIEYLTAEDFTEENNDA
jgi:hypothetical protein